MPFQHVVRISILHLRKLLKRFYEKPAWSIKLIPEQLWLHRKTLSGNKTNKRKQKGILNTKGQGQMWLLGK